MTTIPGTNGFSNIAAKMRSEGLPELFIDTFARYYEQLVAGDTGMIAESEIEAVANLPDFDAIPDSVADLGQDALEHTAFFKLNGGLGTSMGMQHAKSLLAIRGELSFLDIVARQAISAGVPLILMNSFSTEADSLDLLQNYPELKGEIPLSFLQHKAPKITRNALQAAECPDDPQLEWNPPGHGDIYTALVTSGLLGALLDAGYHYAFVSNADNLGAVIDARLLGFLVQHHIPFLMEVADRTEMDKKGGHLARRRDDGRLILRESAQCAAEDLSAFQDVERHRFFNTNNLWLDLRALDAVMAAKDYRLTLPMIRNAKTIDPRDPESEPIYQLETAMGAAIAVFEGAQAVRVPRSRFAPVKTSSDLLAVRSDDYVLTDDFRVIPRPGNPVGLAHVELDRRFYRFSSQLDARFPYGPPSLAACSHLRVTGDFTFGRGVVLEGEATFVNQTQTQERIPDGTVFGGHWRV